MPEKTCPRLIEVALPIREISAESVRDKSLRHGHISTLHLWWARRPLAAARAIVFASLVPDPDHPDCPPEFHQAVIKLLQEKINPLLKGYRRGRTVKNDPDPYQPYPDLPDTPRNRLLTFIAKWSPEWLAFERGQIDQQPGPSEMLDDRSLVKWETSNPKNEQGRAVLEIARKLVLVANHGQAPTVLDPFAGGGSIPLEAARLGCQAIANDYNPVAYLILRATCEFPQKYGKPGKRIIEREEFGEIKREEVEVENVLAYDVEYWAKWILERARQQIGHLYPPGKDGLPVVGYLWARTVPCSNPACRAEIPLLRTFLVCDRPGKHIALSMSVNGKKIDFGIAKNEAITRFEGTMIGGGDCRCPVCNQVTPVEDVRRAGLEGRLGERMTGVIIDTQNGKDYRPVESSDLQAYNQARKLAELIERPSEYIVPEINAPYSPQDTGAHRSISVDIYGFKTFGSLFNSRQLMAMQTICDGLCEVSSEIADDSVDYQKTILTYLGLWTSKLADYLASFGTWTPGGEFFGHMLTKQSIPMVWDYAEVNPFNSGTGGALNQLGWILRVIIHESFLDWKLYQAIVMMGDGAQIPMESDTSQVVITDPPYFDSIAYADLSDFFYVWLKRGLSSIYPDIFTTPQTPKSDEVVAHKHRHHGDRGKGKAHFQTKLAECLGKAKQICASDGIVAVMFAHQSTEAWSALMSALLEAKLNITATYPIDTERTSRTVARNVSALESSITVICRPRQIRAAASFRDVRGEIEQSVAESVHRFWEYGFRGADLIVACYGPAVGVFGRYERVERADGTLVTIPELLDLARQSALKAIAGEFTGDPLSRLYFVWANLYGVSEQAWDDARLVVQIGGESEDAMQVARGGHLFVVDGAVCRLALLRDRSELRHLGEDPESPLIDQLHQAMRLWKLERRTELVQYLHNHALAEHEPFWKLAQALFEVLPRGEEDWKLISALLGERETLRKEARRVEPPAQPMQMTLPEM